MRRGAVLRKRGFVAGVAPRAGLGPCSGMLAQGPWEQITQETGDMRGIGMCAANCARTQARTRRLISNATPKVWDNRECGSRGVGRQLRGWWKDGFGVRGRGQGRRLRREGRGESGGFTLIEVVIALGILAVMMTLAWTTLSQSSRAKRDTEAKQERHYEIRVAMTRMVKDLSMAYLSGNEDPNATERRTIFVGKRKGGVDELRFSSFAHVSLWSQANESEQTLIAYYPGDDRKDSGKTNLLRRESRRLSNESWEQEPAEVDVLLRDVEKVEFSYWDWRDKEWRNDWDSMGADDKRGKLPTRVRIIVEVNNTKGNTIKYTTQARIHMQEALLF